MPALLRQVGDGTFYKVVDGETQFLGATGEYRAVPREPGVLLLADIKRTREPELRNGSAALWDIGDGVACFEFSSKMNSIDEAILKLLEKSIDVVRQRFKALVIYSDATNFSAGANLGLALFACNIAAWGEIEKLVTSGQRTLKAMKYAPFPVVAGVAGLALGGGCEVVLHADAVQAHAESYIGLVECGVGLVPGWGGCGEMLQRWRDAPGAPHGPMPAPSKVFETVSVATVSKSAAEAKSLRFLHEHDGITMNRDRLLFDAKARALSLVEGYAPPKPPEFRLPGAGGRLAMRLAADGYHRQGIASAHDLVVADALAEVLTGGDADYVDAASEKDLLALERKSFMRLIRTGPTLDRIQHTLETGKPLRN